MIYINGRFLTHSMAGIPRFSFEMCKAMFEAGMDIQVVAPESAPRKEYPFPVVYFGKKHSHAWEQIDLYRFMKTTNGALLISFSGLGPALYSNHIMTIHDLAFWRLPQFFSFSYKWTYRFLTPVIARKAKKIITVSQFSKREIIEYLKLPEDKIEVINNALPAGWDALLTAAPERPDKGKYILMVSAKDPRKNFMRTIEAFLSLTLPDVSLYIIGSAGTVFKDAGLSETQSQSIRLLGKVDDEDLVAYYKNALLFAYTSIYEGFGIPPLEAMASGCPVLVSGIEPLQEVCEDAAYYCNPYDVESIAKGMKILTYDAQLKQQLVEAGNKQVKRYAWDVSAKKIQNILNQLDKE